jgi:small subunit ribosomal protein S7e
LRRSSPTARSSSSPRAASFPAQSVRTAAEPTRHRSDQDLVYPVEIVGKRVRTKEDGSKVLKVILDEKERGGVDYRLDTYGEVYKKLTGRGVGFEFPMSGGQEY